LAFISEPFISFTFHYFGHPYKGKESNLLVIPFVFHFPLNPETQDT